MSAHDGILPRRNAVSCWAVRHFRRPVLDLRGIAALGKFAAAIAHRNYPKGQIFPGDETAGAWGQGQGAGRRAGGAYTAKRRLPLVTG